MIYSSMLFLYYFIFILLCIIIMLIESFRVPFDIPESESEMVAGYMTENSALLFSLMLLTEYTNIMFMAYFMIIFMLLCCIMVVDFMIMTSIMRSAFNRMLYDEMMSICWTMLMLLVFMSLLFLVYG